MKAFGLIELGYFVFGSDLKGDADLVLKTNERGGFTGDLKVQ